MQMLRMGMENSYDTSFEFETNQEILAEQFNKMIPDMYALIHWGINAHEDVIEPHERTKDGDNGEHEEPEPEPIVKKRLSYDEIKIDTSDILIDEEVTEFLNSHKETTPGGREYYTCGLTFFVYDTETDKLTYY